MDWKAALLVFVVIAVMVAVLYGAIRVFSKLDAHRNKTLLILLSALPVITLLMIFLLPAAGIWQLVLYWLTITIGTGCAFALAGKMKKIFLIIPVINSLLYLLYSFFFIMAIFGTVTDSLLPAQ